MDDSDKSILGYLFDERKRICLQILYCKKNEKRSSKFITKLNEVTNNNYTFRVLWQPGKSGACLMLKMSDHLSHIVYEGKCTCRSCYIGETVRNCEVRIGEHTNPLRNSEPVRGSKLFLYFFNGGLFILNIVILNVRSLRDCSFNRRAPI